MTSKCNTRVRTPILNWMEKFEFNIIIYYKLGDENIIAKKV